MSSAETGLLQPADQLMVDLVRADQLTFNRPVRRMHEYRLRLPAAHAAMTADQFLEGRHLVGPLVQPTAQHDVPHVRQATVPSQVGGGVRTESDQWVTAFHPPV